MGSCFHTSCFRTPRRGIFTEMAARTHIFLAYNTIRYLSLYIIASLVMTVTDLLCVTHIADRNTTRNNISDTTYMYQGRGGCRVWGGETRETKCGGGGVRFRSDRKSGGGGGGGGGGLSA